MSRLFDVIENELARLDGEVLDGEIALSVKNKKISELENEITRLNNTESELRAELQTLEELHEELDRFVDNLKTENEVLRVKESARVAEGEWLDEELLDGEIALSLKNKKISKLENEITRLNNTESELRAEVEALEERCEKLEEFVVEKEGVIKVAVDKIVMLENELESAKLQLEFYSEFFAEAGKGLNNKSPDVSDDDAKDISQTPYGPCDDEACCKDEADPLEDTFMGGDRCD